MPMSTASKKERLINPVSLILISGDDSLLLTMSALLEKSFTVTVVGTGKTLEDFDDLKREQCPEVVLLDIDLIDNDMEDLQAIVSDQALKVILVVGHNPTDLKKAFSGVYSGAIDFVFKEDLAGTTDVSHYKKELLNHITSVARLDTQVSPMVTQVCPEQEKTSVAEDGILFCEECGARNSVSLAGYGHEEFFCVQCGDLLENHLISQYKRAGYIIIISAGKGSYRNLFNILPSIPSQVTGSIIVVVDGMIGHADSLAAFLDSITQLRVARMSNGSQIEGGCCYVAAKDENFFMKPYSISNKMERSRPTPPFSSIDVMIQSVCESFKSNVAVLFLSGTVQEGEFGLSCLKKYSGVSAVLSAVNCIYKQLGEYILRKCTVDKIVSEVDAKDFITTLQDRQIDTV